MSRSPLALWIPIVCSVAAAFCTAYGEEPTTATRPLLLDSMLITATRLEEENFHIPYACDSIDAEALTTRKAFRTLPEALKEVPGVMVQQTGHGQGSPYIRGFTGYRTLLLIDGIRLNNSVFRDGPNQYWNTIDTLTIERLEVVKGPGSVLYGSDAIGGTVNARTRTRLPEDPSTGAPGLTWERRGYWRYASAEQSHVVRAEVTKKNVGDGLVHGAELGLAWGFYDGFTAFGNVAWLKGDADTYVGDRKRRRPMSRIQPAQALLGLRWESPSRKYAVETTVMIAGKQDRLSPGDVNDGQRIPAGGTPGYTTYALRGSAEVLDGTRVFAAVENITDRDYRIHGSGQNAPGTNAILGVDCRF